MHENSKKEEPHTHTSLLPLTVNNSNLCIQTGSKQLWRFTKTRITKKKRTIPAVLCTQNTVQTTEPENICWVRTNKTTTSNRRKRSASGASENILDTLHSAPETQLARWQRVFWPSIWTSRFLSSVTIGLQQDGLDETERRVQLLSEEEITEQVSNIISMIKWWLLSPSLPLTPLKDQNTLHGQRCSQRMDRAVQMKRCNGNSLEE